MNLNEENIKLILGLKIKQLRLEKGISLAELSIRCSISASYLNEIEKGKKHPKPSKISQIAESLDVTYDWLVSLQLEKRLQPLGELLHSNVLQEFPLEHFGVDPAKLIDLFATAPTKLSAFINTLLEISRSYDLKVEQFYFSALRSYQEIHNNYFPDIENSVESFCKEFNFSNEGTPTSNELAKLLESHYNIAVEQNGLAKHPKLKTLRSVFIPGKVPHLLLNPDLTEQQKAFTLARELGFQYLKLSPRPMTSSWVKVGSFDEVLNNFMASYFGGALIINRDRIVEDLNVFFQKETWNENDFIELLQGYSASPELLLHRFTSLLPKFFGIKSLFFLRFNRHLGEKNVHLTKELHLNGQHNPHGTYLHEHYCRRWASIRVLNDLESQQEKGKYLKPIVDIQKSTYIDSGHSYLVLSIARHLHPTPDTNCSVTIGLKLDDQLRKKLKFTTDIKIPTYEVNKTCERCSLTNCKERVAEPKVYNKLQAQKELENEVERLFGG